MSLLLSSLKHYDALLQSGRRAGGGGDAITTTISDNSTTTRSRSSVRRGNLEVFSNNNNNNETNEVNNEDDDNSDISICNLAALMPFSMQVGGPGGRPFYLTDMYGLVSPQFALAIEHLNTGNGTLVSNIQNLHQRCPIKFTIEMLDTGLIETLAVNEVIRVTDRQYPAICAFQGAGRSAVSMATATITSLRGYPQISAASTSPVLSSPPDIAQQLYPLFGRIIPSDDGITIPIIDLFINVMKIQHVAVLYVNDPFGTAFARGLQDAAAAAAANATSPLTLKTIELPPHVSDDTTQQGGGEGPTTSSSSSTEEDGGDGGETIVQRAVRELQQTEFQYIFVIMNNNELLHRIMEEAYTVGIAGTDTHTWMFSQSSFLAIVEIDTPQNSIIHKALSKGTGIIMPQHNPNSPTLTKYFNSLRKLVANPTNMEYLISKSPNPDAFTTTNIDEFFSGITFDPNDPYAPFIYDSIIALGLGICEAHAAANGNHDITGQDHFNAITRTSFVGVSGPVVLNPITGSREPSSSSYGFNRVITKPSTKTDDNNDNDDGNITFGLEMVSIYDHGTWRQITPFTYADGSTIPLSDLPELNTEPNYMGTGWRVAGWTMCGLGISFTLFFALWTKQKSYHRVITASQPFFLYIICFGIAIFVASIIPLSLDEQIATHDGCSIACNSVLWLLSTGFCVTFSAMFTKTQRVNKIFQHSRFSRIKVTAVDVAKPMIACLGANLVLLILMTVLAPPTWTIQILEEDQFERPIETRGFCNWSNSIPFLIPLAIINLGCLLYAMLQAYEARGISIEFAESDYIFKCMVVITLAAFLSFPVLLSIHESSHAFYFFFSATVFVTGTLVLLLMFIPKMRILYEKQNRPPERNVRVSIYGSTLGPLMESQPLGDSLSQGEDGLRVLHHPKTEANLRERVADLESRLRKYQDTCTCRHQQQQEGDSIKDLSVPLTTPKEEQQYLASNNQDKPKLPQTPHNRESSNNSHDVSTEPSEDYMKPSSHEEERPISNCSLVFE